MISLSIVSTSPSTDEYSMGWKTQSRYLIHTVLQRMAKGFSPCSMIWLEGDHDLGRTVAFYLQR